VLAVFGFVLALGTTPALHAEPDRTRGASRRVVAKPPGLQLKDGDRLVRPRVFDIYRVEKVDGSRLRLRGEREGYSGWADSAQVVPIGQAVAFYTDYIRANPDDPYGYTIRGIIHERELREFDLALADYNEVIRLSPTGSYAYNNRGQLWFAKGEYDRAIADHTQAIRLDSTNALAWNHRGGDWLAKREFDRALADFDGAHRVAPASDSAEFSRLYVLYAARRDGAVEVAGRLLEGRGWRGHNALYVVIIGHLAALQSDRSGPARTFLDEAAARCDRSAWPYPVVKYLRGEIDEATLLAAATDNGKMTEARCYLGLKMIQSKRREAALSHLQWVMLQGDPTFLEYAVAMAELDTLTGK
jgi:lipoprotein NlpI